MEHLHVEVVPWPEALIVHVRGEGTLGEVAALERGLLGVSAQHPAVAVLELSGLTYISSLAMGALVAFAKGIALAGGQVVSAGARTLVREAMLRARLDALIPMFQTVEEAVVGTSEAQQAQRPVA